ncbi:hypothetical protein FACS189426_07620 [Bacteroidia bacterium]|nr:hypothetical protein FACS189426_07620 [Bacteroidia bacterium]GHT84166.1 hypothetical protein FACS18947_1230 [Bacteroidia bacterium]
MISKDELLELMADIESDRLDKGDVIVVEVTPTHFPPVRLRDNKNLNIKRISELANIPYRSAARYLKNLRDNGFVIFVGSAKNGEYWILG